MAGSMHWLSRETVISVHILYLCSNVCVIIHAIAPRRYMLSALEKQASYGLITAADTLFLSYIYIYILPNIQYEYQL